MLIFQHLLLTPSLLWILLLTVTFLVLTLALLLYSTTISYDQVTMPSPECVKPTSFNNVQKFFNNHNKLVSSTSKSVPTWRSKSSNGEHRSTKVTLKERDNNVNFCKKGLNSGNSSSDDSSDRSEHAPRVVAVAMKSNKIKVSCQSQVRNLPPEKCGKGDSWNSTLQWTVKNNNGYGIKSANSLHSVSLEQLLRNGSSRKEQGAEKFPAISRSNSLTHDGEKSQQVGKPLFLSHVSTSNGSVNNSDNNLSTVIAVNPVGSEEEINTVTNDKLSTEKAAADDERLSSTVITVNCSNSQEGGSLNSLLLPSKVKDFNGKSLVWREIKEKYMQNQPSEGVKVTVSISSQPEECNDIPPPVPPLPVALRRKFFKNEGKIINSKEHQFKVELISPSVSGKAPLPLNQLCLHPKIKLKSLQTSPTSSNHKPSRIPKLRPAPTGLRSVDCLVSLYEDGIVAEQRRKEIQKEGEQKKRIGGNMKQRWEELFMKYEALENECDSMSSVSNTSACKSSGECVNKVGNVFDVKRDRSGNQHNSFKTIQQNSFKAFKLFETGRLKSAPCSLLHLKGDTESDNTVVLNSVVSRTNSEINLCSKSAKEEEWPVVSSYKENMVCLTSSKSEKEINNNRVVLQQSGKDGESVQCSNTGAVVRLGNVDIGGIGVVRASTGRQVSSCRYRTELEV